MSGIIVLNAKRGLTRMSSNATRQSVISFWKQLKALSQKEAGDVVEISVKRNSNNVKGTIQLREGIDPKKLRGITGFFRRIAETIRFLLGRFKPASKAEIAGKNPFTEAAKEAKEAAAKPFIKPGPAKTAGKEVVEEAAEQGGQKAAQTVVNAVKLSENEAAAVAKLIATPQAKGRTAKTMQSYVTEALNAGKARFENNRLVIDADFVPRSFAAKNGPKPETRKLFEVIKGLAHPEAKAQAAMADHARGILGADEIARLSGIYQAKGGQGPVRSALGMNISMIESLIKSGKLNEMLEAGAKAAA